MKTELSGILAGALLGLSCALIAVALAAGLLIVLSAARRTVQRLRPSTDV